MHDVQAIDLPFDKNLEGYVSGSEISIIQEYTDGRLGPRLHRHPYSETFIVRRGEALFTAATSSSSSRGRSSCPPAAQVRGARPGFFESIHIHANEVRDRVARVTRYASRVISTVTKSFDPNGPAYTPRSGETSL